MSFGNDEQRDIQLTCWLDEHVGHFITRSHQVKEVSFTPRRWDLDEGLYCLNCSEFFKDEHALVH